MNEIQIEDKTYISSKRAAEITGYAKDYVGQLCREGHVDAKMVGRSWYVYEPSIRAHRFGEATPESIEETEADSEAEIEAAELENATEETEIPSDDAKSVWQSPRYTHEEPEFIPEVSAINQISETSRHSVEPAEALTDMQQAWKEWFSHKQELHEEENSLEEEGIQEEAAAAEEAVAFQSTQSEPEELEMAQEEEKEESIVVPLHKIQEPEPEESRYISHGAFEIAPIRRDAPIAEEEQGRIVEERVVRKGSKKRSKKRIGSTSNAPAIALLLAISLVAIVIAIIGTGFGESYLRTSLRSNPVVNFLVGDSTYSR